MKTLESVDEAQMLLRNIPMKHKIKCFFSFQVDPTFTIENVVVHHDPVALQRP